MQFSESLSLIQTSTRRSWELFQVDKWDKMLTLDFAQNPVSLKSKQFLFLVAAIRDRSEEAAWSFGNGSWKV
jgi:hypothetical protein